MSSLRVDSLTANRLAETSPYLLQHKDNPVDWRPWGPRRSPRRRGGQADPPLDRLLRLPLVPRDGARVLRGPRDRCLHERALRADQGRSRGAPRRRRHLHGGRPGHDRPGRLAADRVPRLRGRPLLRRHLLPAGAPPRACRASGRCLEATAGAYRDATRGAARGLGPDPGVARGRGQGGAVRRSRSTGRSSTVRSRACRPASTTPTAASAERRSSRRRSRSSSCSPAASTQPVGLTLDKMMHGGDLRPARGRLRALLGRRGLAGPPLREDALRQRAARARLPPRLAGDRHRALAAGLRARRSTGPCARCAGRRAASTPRSTRTPRARRVASTSGRRTRCGRP